MPERRQPRHPKGAPASQGGRFARPGRPEGEVSLPAEAPLTEGRLRALAAALRPDEGTTVLQALAHASPEALAGRARSLWEGAGEGPGEQATAEELAAYVHPDQSTVVLFEVLGHPACQPELALQMMRPDYPVIVRAEVVRQGWPGSARRGAHDPHPYVRAQAIGAWDLDQASAEALRADAEAQQARAALLRPQ